MKTFSLYIETTRPKTWIAAFSPLLLISAKYFADIKSNLLILLSIFVSTLLVQILTNFFNDYFDLLQNQDTTLRTGPKRPFQRGDLSEAQMKRSLELLSGCYFLVSLPIVINLKFLGSFLVIISYFLSIYYTKGKYSISRLGISDVFSFCFFGPIATTITGYSLTGIFQLSDFLLGCATGALSTILLTINHLRDEKEDSITGKTTIIVRFGQLYGKILVILLILIIQVLPIFLFNLNSIQVFLYFISTLMNKIFYSEFLKCYTLKKFSNLLPKAALLFCIQTLLFFLMITCNFVIA